MYEKNSIIQRKLRIINLLLAEVFVRKLHVLSKSFSYRRFVELLSASQLFNDASFFKFSLKLLQRFFNVFAFFYRYYNHFVTIKYVMV